MHIHICCRTRRRTQLRHARMDMLEYISMRARTHAHTHKHTHPPTHTHPLSHPPTHTDLRARVDKLELLSQRRQCPRMHVRCIHEASEVSMPPHAPALRRRRRRRLPGSPAPRRPVGGSPQHWAESSDHCVPGARGRGGVAGRQGQGV